MKEDVGTKEDLSAFLPLSPAALHILLALAADDLHGYAIMQEVSRQSAGRYRIGPGTLYDNLQKLAERRLVEELGPRAGDDDPRRRYYRLTARGHTVLAAEVDRLKGVVREANLRLRARKPRRA
jgi:DNA-binding PadR family transcriptional regulator